MSKTAQNVMLIDGSMSLLETGFGTNFISAENLSGSKQRNESLL